MTPTFTEATFANLDTLDVEALLLLIPSDRRPLRGVAAMADWRLCGELSAALQGGTMRGGVGERLLMSTRGRIGPSRILAFGMGPAARDVAAQELTALFDSARAAGAQELALELPSGVSPEAGADAVRGFRGKRLVVLGASDALKERVNRSPASSGSKGR